MNRQTFLNEAVVEVKPEQGSGDARIAGHGRSYGATDDGLCVGAAGLVEFRR